VIRPATKQPVGPEASALDYLFARSRQHTNAYQLHARLKENVKFGDVQWRGVSSLGREAIIAELATVLGRALATRIVDIAAGGWQTSAKLRDAARRTAGTPGTCEVVTLEEHTITFTDVPTIRICIRGAVPAEMTVTAQITVDIHVTGLAANVEDGRMLDLRSGDSSIKVSLAVNGQAIASQDAKIDLHAVLPLGQGIPLLSEAERTPGPPPRNGPELVVDISDSQPQDVRS
jgi:hypothetical protein